MTADQEAALIALVPMARRALNHNNVAETRMLLTDAAMCLKDPEYAARFVKQHEVPK